MPEIDLPLICRIALEESPPGELLLDTVQRVCLANYGPEGPAVFVAVVAAIEQALGAGAAGPDAAVAAVAAGEPGPALAPRRPWWQRFGG